jgi:hypothetical protein
LTDKDRILSGENENNVVLYKSKGMDKDEVNQLITMDNEILRLFEI